MAELIHKNLTGVEALHQATYVGSVDPGAVGAHKFWSDETDPEAPVLKKRNATNTAWKTYSGVDLSTKADLVAGKVPAAQLPSYVDDVLEYLTQADFPATGETGKIYVITTGADINKTYRWTGSVYVQTGGVGASGASDASITFTDITTNNVSTDKHGFAPKAPNDATKFLNGVGAYTVPPGGASAFEYGVAVSDEVTALTTGTSKLTFRFPCGVNLTAIRASVSVASTSGVVTVDVKNAGTTVFGTNKLSIDATEKTSQTAATAASFTTQTVADDAEITVDITVAGTGAKGLKLTFLGTRS